MSTTTSLQRFARRLRVTPVDVRDAVVAFVLLGLASLGFRAAFGTSQVILVGLVAAAVGIAIGFAAVRLRLNALVVLAATLLAHVLIGGPLIAFGETLFGLPTPGSFRSVVNGSLRGWSDLVRTAAPVGTTGNLLAVPVLCALVGGVCSMLIAGRTRRAELVIVPAVAVLVVSVLTGTYEPESLLLQGVVFAGVAAWWMSDRFERGRTIRRETDPFRRVAYVVGMVAAAGLVALTIGPSLPVLGGRDRYVLRDRIEPQFDPRAYPSPLVSLRRYVTGPTKEEPVLLVRGIEAGEPIRLAVLDAYDGVVWGVGLAGAQFGPTGERLAGGAEGKTGRIEVEVVSLGGVWVPTVGSPRSLDVSADLAEQLRYSRHSGMLAKPLAGDPNPLKAGDRFAFDRVPMTTPAAEVLARLEPVREYDALVSKIPDDFAGLATAVVAGRTQPYEQAKALADHFAQGYYNDGSGTAAGTKPSPAGHSLNRLSVFVHSPVLQGDAEQYAATMALYASAIGLPARVVVGFRTDEASTDGDVLTVPAKAYDAWVEVAFRDPQSGWEGWVAFDPTPPPSRVPPETPPPTTTTTIGSASNTPAQTKSDVPDAALPPPTTTTRACDVEGNPCEATGDEGNLGELLAVAASVVGTGAVVFAGPPAVIVGLKKRRRRRRRNRPDPSAQVAGGWDELLDRAADIGHVVPDVETRVEAARTLGYPAIVSLANEADAATFGGSPLSVEHSDAYWTRVDHSIAALSRDLDRRAKMRAALSIQSLRGARRRPPAAAEGDPSPFPVVEDSSMMSIDNSR